MEYNKEFNKLQKSGWKGSKVSDKLKYQVRGLGVQIPIYYHFWQT
jgi:hypothetical protein